MIDAFWTKWRVRRLCSGDPALVGRWLDDYAGWLYGRLWVQSAQDSVRAQRALIETFSHAASRLRLWSKQSSLMSVWLTEQSPAEFAQAVSPFPHTPEMTEQVRAFWTQSLSDESVLLPGVIDAGQRALALLGRDEQEMMICRYLRLETAAQIASACGQPAAEIERLLYRARHSFRRAVESMVGMTAAAGQSVSPASQEVLDVNLEKIFHSFGLKPACDAQTRELLRAAVLQNLSHARDQAGGIKHIAGRWGWFWAAIAMVVGVCGVFYLCRTPHAEPLPEVAGTPGKIQPPLSDKTAAPSVDVEQQLKRVFELGLQQDVEGLIEIVRNGAYPAQLASAHYLGQFGDKSAIDPLDRAAQKWYPSSPGETNPFVDAIAAIESRIQEQKKRQDLAQRKQMLLETALPLIQKRLKAGEPNAAVREPNEPNTAAAVPPMTPSEAVQPEPNRVQREPNEPNVTGTSPAAGGAEPNNPVDPNSIVHNEPTV